MEERKWWKESVVYQIYPRSFYDSNGDGIGDLNGITAKLDYLSDLGISVIWLNPIFKSPNDDNGYDISDYQAIMDEFGTMADFDNLLAAAHARHIRVVLDLVVNHTSDEHPWFIESRKSQDNDYRDFYIWRKGKKSGSPENGGLPPNNWGASFGGSAWEYDAASDSYYLHMFSKKQPDLNWENERVRKSVFDMMTWWGNKGIDGFRMDVITMISKDQRFPDGEVNKDAPQTLQFGNASPYVANGPRIHEFLQEMNRTVISKFDWLTVGEGAGSDAQLALSYTGFDRGELNMLFTFEHMDLCKPSRANGWQEQKLDLVALKRIFALWQESLEGKGWNTLYWENHDQVRSVSRFGSDSAQWHDKSAKMLALCLHGMKGTPFVFQGEELGMTNMPFASIEEYRDIESRNYYAEMKARGFSDEKALHALHLISRDNSRTPMQWDSSKNAGFSTGTPWIRVNPNYTSINAAAQMRDADSVRSFYKSLISLRRENQTLVYGRFELLFAESAELFVYTRTLGDSSILVVCNFTAQEVPFEIPERFAASSLLLSNYCDTNPAQKSVRPYEAAAFQI